MTETVRFIYDTFRQFFGSGWYFLYAAAAVLLLLHPRMRSRKGDLLSVLTIAVLAVFSFPPAAAFLVRFMRDGVVYWRILWLLPLSALISFAVIEAEGLFSGKWRKALFLAAAAALLIAGGRNLYLEGPFQAAAGREKIPERTMTVARVVEANAEACGNPYKRLAGPPDITCQIRQIDPSIRQSYARVFHTEELEPEDGWNYYLRVMYDNYEDKKERITDYLNYLEVNYAVFRSGRGMDRTLEKGGFTKIYDENDLEIWYNPDTVEKRTAGQGYGPG